VEPTEEPTEEPTVEPTEEPTVEPTEEPTVEPAEEPTVGGASAKTASYTTQLFLQNPNTSETTYGYTFYPENGGSSIDVAGGTLNAHGSVRLDVGTTSLSSPWRGSGQIAAQLPILAAVGATASGGDLMVHTGFNAGATSFFAPSVAKSLGSKKLTTLLAVQNVTAGDVDVTVTYYNSVGTTLGTDQENNLGASYSAFFDLGDKGAKYNDVSAASISATGNIVAATNTYAASGEAAQSMKSLPGGGPVVYLPTAIRSFGSQNLNLYVALQNPNNSSIYAEVQYYDTNGNKAGSLLKVNIPALEKRNAHPSTAGVSSGFLGSGIVRGWTNSNKTTQADVIAIGNIGSSSVPNANYSFTGVAGGSTNVGCPYVNWSTSSLGYKTYLAIQNVGSGTASQITVTYYNTNGTQEYKKKFNNVESLIKVNTKPLDFTSSNWQGAVEVTSADEPIAVLINVTRGDNRYKASYICLDVL
jgi:hypothetical protein